MTQFINKSIIKAEIERLVKEYILSNSAEAKYRCEAYGELLEFINSLQEEPVSEELEEAANDYAHDLVHDDVFENFIAGAKWQKEQCQKTIELAEDHAYLAGQEKMIDKACDAYCKVCGHYPHSVPTHICRHDCRYFSDFKNYMKGE